MAAGLPNLPPGILPGAMPQGPGSPPPTPGPAPSPAPSPVSALMGARPGGGGGMSEKIMQFLAGVGFQHFVNSINKLRGGGGKGEGKKTQAGGLLQNLAASRALPQAGVTPPSSGNIPPMLAGGQGVPFTALLSQLAAAANRGNS